MSHTKVSSSVRTPSYETPSYADPSRGTIMRARGGAARHRRRAVCSPFGLGCPHTKVAARGRGQPRQVIFYFPARVQSDAPPTTLLTKDDRRQSAPPQRHRQRRRRVYEYLSPMLAMKAVQCTAPHRVCAYIHRPAGAPAVACDALLPARRPSGEGLACAALAPGRCTLRAARRSAHRASVKEVAWQASALSLTLSTRCRSRGCERGWRATPFVA